MTQLQAHHSMAKGNEQPQSGDHDADEKDANLVRMVEQIVQFFKLYPHDQAVHSIADHLEKFWEKRMRSAIIDYEKHHDTGLSPLARAAIRQLKPIKS